MAKIDPRLLEKLTSRLGLSKARVYQLIADTANQLLLDSRLAAIALANANGISVSRYASASDLAEIRGTNRKQENPAPASVKITRPKTAAVAKGKVKKKKTNTVLGRSRTRLEDTERDFRLPSRNIIKSLGVLESSHVNQKTRSVYWGYTRRSVQGSRCSRSPSHSRRQGSLETQVSESERSEL